MERIKHLIKDPKSFKQLLITDSVLFGLILITIAAGLIIARSMVSDAEAATATKAAAIQEQVVEVDLSQSLQSYTAAQVTSSVAIPNYTLDQLYAMDLRQPSGLTEADLKLITKAGLVGLEKAFVEAEEKYGVNCLFLISIASLESAHGTMMFRPNNMFGYGGSGYPSKEACIMDVAQGLSSKYLNPSGSLYGGSPTLKGVNSRYAANPQWHAKVGKYMQQYYSVISKRHADALAKIQ